MGFASLYPTYNLKMDTALVPCQALFVGWVEQSETQHDTLNQYMLGFALLYPFNIDCYCDYLLFSPVGTICL